MYRSFVRVLLVCFAPGSGLDHVGRYQCNRHKHDNQYRHLPLLFSSPVPVAYRQYTAGASPKRLPSVAVGVLHPLGIDLRIRLSLTSTCTAFVAQQYGIGLSNVAPECPIVPLFLAHAQTWYNRTDVFQCTLVHVHNLGSGLHGPDITPQKGPHTMTDESKQETFEEFKNSFSYGPRLDLNFRFLRFLPSADAATFFQELLYRLGDSVDDGQVERLADLFFEYQCAGYAGSSKWTYESGPFLEVEKPVSEMRVALMSSSGHFVAGKDPEPFGVPNMTQEEAAARMDEFLSIGPTLSTIPIDTPLDQLRVRHGGYDIRSAQEDPNVVFPITRMRELADEGRIGSLAPNAFSFVGGCAQTVLTRRAAPQWAKILQIDEIEAVVLVPVCPVCHVSVGHVAREFERSGLATVVIGVAPHRDRLAAMSLPRAVVTQHPMGRALGAPHDAERQTEVLHAALDLLETAEEGGAIVDLTAKYRSAPS